MKPHLLATIVWLALVPSAFADDAADDFKKLQGDWVPAMTALNGKPLPDEAVKGMTLTIKDKTYKVVSGPAVDAGALTIDPSKKPREMDITGGEGPNKGKTIPAIYEVTEDTLRICYGLRGTPRPSEFKSEEGGKGVVFLVTYKRPEKK